MMARVFNFSAGPSMLPEPVLKAAQAQLLDYGCSGQSVMEMSHRSSAFEPIIQGTEAALRRVLAIPDGYRVGFFQGGASTQFAMVPMNLMTTGHADYIVTGNFANRAAKEAAKFGRADVVASSKDANYTYIPDVDAIPYTPGASYVHICENNTIFGTRYTKLPQVPGVPLVADMSSCILSRPTDVSQYGLIYFGVQKNVAPAGMAVVIVREDLVGHAGPSVPDMLNYQTILDADSMYNTPPCWCIYMLGLVLDWLEEQGGIPGMEAIKHKKAQMLYDVIDSSRLFTCAVEPGSRSDMNVVFRTGSDELDAKFVQESVAAGFTNLKGHRSVGGMRASIYNAMPTEGVEKLCDFIKAFDRAN